MDQKTYLKELAKHVQRNTSNPREENSSQDKAIQISMHKDNKTKEMDPASLELYRQMMADRYQGSNTEE